MDFEFDDDQRDLQAAAADILSKECPASYLRSVVDDDHDPSDLWKTLCSLDWPGLAVPAEHGGVGLTSVELAIVVEQLGYVGDPTPFVATTTQFVPFIVACGDDEQRSRFLGGVTAGVAGTVAIAGDTGRWGLTGPPVTATRNGDEWVLEGTASFVVDGDRAEEIVVLASTDSGIQAFVVPGDAVTATVMPAIDPSLHVATVDFAGVTVADDRRLAGRDVDRGIERAFEEAVGGMAMMTVGACQRGLDMAIEYVKEREQFGVPVGSFQAVKHKVVDMHVAVERARALAYFAALTVATDDPRRSLAASMAKAAAGDAQRLVFQDGIQLFGGIGFTWENDVHLYLRRAKSAELLFGGAAEHRAIVGAAVMGANRSKRS